jgi:flavodoxin
MKIVYNSMSGSTKEEADKNYERIAKNIAKETVISHKA